MHTEFKFYIPTELYFGSGALGSLHEHALPGKKALIVITRGKSVKANGYLDDLTGELKLAGVEYAIFDNIGSNPQRREVNEAAAMAKEEKCDFVIGLGGGSSIDAAKAIALLAANEGDYWDYMQVGTGGKAPVRNTPLPVVAITTTAGTGTEADGIAVITNEETNEKVGFSMPDMFPRLSIVDPDLMKSVPPAFTAYQGFDALFHAVECYITQKANLMSEMLSVTSVRNVAAYLARAVRDGNDEEARIHMAYCRMS